MSFPRSWSVLSSPRITVRITVFGASGKVGGLVVQDALGRGHAVQAFVHSRDPFEGQEEVTVITGEVADTAAVYAAMAGRAQRMSVLSAGK